MRGHGGNRRDRQKSEQPVERGLLTGVDGGKNVVNRGHLHSPCGYFALLSDRVSYHNARISSSHVRPVNDGAPRRPASKENRGISQTPTPRKWAALGAKAVRKSGGRSRTADRT